MRQRHRAQRDLRKKMGVSDFIPGWKIAGEQNDLNSFGCYEEKGPQGSRSRSRKASEDTDVIIQVSSTWWLGLWWVEEMERSGWVLHILWENPHELWAPWVWEVRNQIFPEMMKTEGATSLVNICELPM